jgi:AGCS family alanine or glycine:cation symporter
VWDARLPTEITLTGGDLTYVEILDNGAPSSVTPPPELRIEAGRHIEAGAARVAWHDVEVEELFVDAEFTELFSGTVRPDEQSAEADDGQTYTSLYGLAAESGAPLTQEGFRRGLSPIGDWGHYIVVLAVMLFAISTAISWSYYGDRCANYLFGAPAVLPYKFAFVIMHFVGAVLPLTVIWNLGDIFLAVVIVPNLIALVLLSPQVVEMTRSYFRRKPWLENEAKRQALRRAGKL